MRTSWISLYTKAEEWDYSDMKLNKTIMYTANLTPLFISLGSKLKNENGWVKYQNIISHVDLKMWWQSDGRAMADLTDRTSSVIKISDGNKNFTVILHHHPPQFLLNHRTQWLRRVRASPVQRTVRNRCPPLRSSLNTILMAEVRFIWCLIPLVLTCRRMSSSQGWVK